VTFRLLTASLLQAIRSTDCTVSFISQRSAVIVLDNTTVTSDNS